MASRSVIAQCLRSIEANWRDFRIVAAEGILPGTLDVWEMAMPDIPDHVLILSVVDCIQAMKFPPQVADVRDFAAKRANDGAPSESEAWRQVLSAMSHGYAHPRWVAEAGESQLKRIPFTHPAIQAALDDVGGILATKDWQAVDMDKAHAPRFCRAYAARLAQIKSVEVQKATDTALGVDLLRQLGADRIGEIQEEKPKPDEEGAGQ